MSAETTLQIGQVITAIQRVSQLIQANEQYLNELDAVVGDGEHGFNLSRAFKQVKEKLPTLPSADLAGLLKGVGRELIAAGGGAGTTLYGTAFLSASKVAGTAVEIDGPLLAGMLSSALEDICKRGGAKPGDKTMVDALQPAVDALQAAVQGNQSPSQALKAAAAAAREGAEKTKTLVGRKGRSLYAGERALGTPDPGAVSSYLIVAALAGEDPSVPL